MSEDRTKRIVEAMMCKQDLFFDLNEQVKQRDDLLRKAADDKEARDAEIEQLKKERDDAIDSCDKNWTTHQEMIALRKDFEDRENKIKILRSEARDANHLRFERGMINALLTRCAEFVGKREWEPTMLQSMGHMKCDSCKQFRKDGHKSDCERVNLLADIKKQLEGE